MSAKVIVLADYRKKKERKSVKGRPPARWNLMNPADIPPNKKGIVSGEVLRCPVCHAPCFLTKPVGRGSRTWFVRSPICGFSCPWSGENHLCQPDPRRCPGCAQNPMAPKREEEAEE